MVYRSHDGRYNEAAKLTAAGRMGEARQTLRFDLPASTQPYTGVRLDPADRPGFFRLHSLTISLPEGEVAWQWHANHNDSTALVYSPHHEMLIAAQSALTDSLLLILYGDDPWLELPIPKHVLDRIATAGARLEVSAGWPMSADYLAASGEINSWKAVYSQSLATAQQSLLKERQEVALTVQNLDAKTLELDTCRSELLHRTQEHLQLQSEALLARQELTIVRNSLSAVRAEQHKLLATLELANVDKDDANNRVKHLTQYLHGIEQSTLFRVTRPLVNLKMSMDRLYTGSNKATDMPTSITKTEPIPIPRRSVDIIVPVYRGLEDTRRCIRSVLASSCITQWRLIVINDCSPEPEVSQWLRDLAQQDRRVELLENNENLGFVSTVNRGMALHTDNDVLLLNSDAEVANNWLDRIQQAAYSAARVASVTPFSNNATICSYPNFCKPNVLPIGFDTASLDLLFAKHLSGQTIEIPTGVGFCMYIRRQALNEIGYFDVANFGRGYGEENDFCVRAQQAGWHHLHALDTFVMHAGGISFGYSKNERELQAMETLRRLHPRYESDVMDFIARDPARPARLAIDIARITTSERPVILNVIHNREGGTVRHIEEIAQRLGGLATFLRLTPAPRGVVLRLEGQHEAFALHFGMPQDQFKLLQTLRLLQVGHIHYHHLLGHASFIADLPAQLGVSHDFTAHDYYSYCPQISLTNHTDRYCGELGLEQCRQCLQRNPAPGGVSIESWREQHGQLLNSARYVIAPSLDTAMRLRRFVPNANVMAIHHSKLETVAPQHPAPRPIILNNPRRLKVVVLGALSRIKGADVLEEVATLAAQQTIPVDFHLIGYAYRSLRTQPKARLTVHGAYDDKDLPQLLQWLQPDLVWFPAVWPETYSYTLSASLESGLPIVAPNIGAFAERLQNRDWTWLCDWQQTSSQWLAFFNHLREHHFSGGISPSPIMPIYSETLTEGEVFDYRGGYLQSVPRPVAPDTSALLKIQQQLSQNLYWLDTSSPPGNALKLSTLRTIVRLRASSALSPLARLVPTHLQRRVKSWLGK